MNTSKGSVVISGLLGKFASIFGYCFAFTGIVGLSTELSKDGESSGVVVAIIFAVLGVSLIVHGSRIKRRIKRFKQYISLISAQRMTSIGSIAAATLQYVDFVKKDLKKMISIKYFINATINEATNEIVIYGMAPMPTAVDATAAAAAYAAAAAAAAATANIQQQQATGQPQANWQQQAPGQPQGNWQQQATGQPQSNWQQQATGQPQATTEQPQSDYETFTCPGCGASGTKRKGEPGNCDYCGSLIK